jgi:hypothetical protein
MAMGEKCVLCPGYIGDDEETTNFYLNPVDEEKSIAHLKCFIKKHFITTSSFECTPSDVVIVSAYEICGWCRQLGIVVARMPRTDQAICNRCHEIVGKLLMQSDAKQIFLDNSISSEQPIILGEFQPEELKKIT